MTNARASKGQHTPLRDRLLSNSPDPLKNAILRGSGAGWSPTSSDPDRARSPPTPPSTSPLRIAKRPASPAQPMKRLTRSAVKAQADKDKDTSNDPPKEKAERGQAFPARRSSNSYKHLRTHNLVSQSPFKSRLPTSTAGSSHVAPFPRKVSGEKRPRTASMEADAAEAENARPTLFPGKKERERRQSKGFQGLAERSPVSKSPFKRGLVGGAASSVAPPAPMNNSTALNASKALPAPPTPPKGLDRGLPERPSPSRGSPSPARSSLVSRRLHGPRVSSGSTRRVRRKTVTFDEECDVLEFEDPSDVSGDAETEQWINADAMEENVFGDESGEGELIHAQALLGEGAVLRSRPLTEDLSDSDEDEKPCHIEGQLDHEESFDSVPLNDEANAVPHTPLTETAPSILFEDVEDDVPLGRTHHAMRAAAYHQETQQHPPPSIPSLSFSHSPVPTTPRRPYTRQGSPSPGVGITADKPDRAETSLASVREDDDEEDEEDAEIADAVELMPGSPSPIKSRTGGQGDILIPKFNLDSLGGASESDDPFTYNQKPSEATEETAPDVSFNSSQSESSARRVDERGQDGLDLSIGQSDVSLSVLEAELGLDFVLNAGKEAENSRDEPMQGRAASPRGHVSSPLGRVSSPPATGRVSSPLGRVLSPNSSPRPTSMLSPRERVISPRASPLNRHSIASPPDGGASPRQRISRDDVQRRLAISRGSPSPEPSHPVMMGDVEEAAMAIDKRVDVDVDVERKTGMLEVSAEAESASVHTDEGGSAEGATIERAERKIVPPSSPAQSRPMPAIPRTPQAVPQLATPMRGLAPMQLDFGSGVDMDMRSALDRLLDDVAGGHVEPASAQQHSLPPREHHAEDSFITEDGNGHEERDRGGREPRRAATDTALLSRPAFTSPPPSRTVSGSTIPPAPPPKDSPESPLTPGQERARREQRIIEARREARQREEWDALGYGTPPRNAYRLSAIAGRTSRRRSRSTGDAGNLLGERSRAGRDDGGMLGPVHFEVKNDELSDSITKELNKLGGPSKNYAIKEREVIYASSDAGRIKNVGDAGDIDGGRAWRTVRRPSDMNEYSKQIKEFRAQEKPGKAHGKVFVKVMGVRNLRVPLPKEPTAVTCTLNNGIHFVTTPETKLESECKIEQEFELIEHSKLEFTLTLKVRRDPHVIEQFKALSPPASMPPLAPVTSRSGMRSFFSSSPKKTKPAPPVQNLPPPPLPENLARYLKPDGVLARAFVSFKDVAPHCDTRLFETRVPLIGQRVETAGQLKTRQVGELVVQMFRLPALPGMKGDMLPQSLDECLRGLRHVNWHKVTYFEGVLTQNGGDCTTWRRRQLRVVGAHLVAFNDVTKKATATIDLRKATSVQDGANDAEGNVMGVEHAFRLVFKSDEIVFFADTEEEKGRWLEILHALVGRIPPNPLWGELVWQRQHELAKAKQREATEKLAAAGPSILTNSEERSR